MQNHQIRRLQVPVLCPTFAMRKETTLYKQVMKLNNDNEMKKMTIFYGSTTGTCETLAYSIAQALGMDNNSVHNVTEMTKEALEESDALILGSATWGCGDLQDDWYDGVDILKQADLTGKTVALFACGDGESYGDTFCEAMTHLHDALSGSGCVFIGQVPTEGYTFISSTAVDGDHFIGLALDDVNESEKSEERIANWAKQIMGEMV